MILGGGATGIRAATILAAAGKRVGLCEPNQLGGYEATDGFMLRAGLIRAAGLYTSVKAAVDIGIRGGSVGYNYPTLRQWNVDSYQASAKTHDIKHVLAKAGVHVYESSARFIGPHEITFGRQHVSSAQFLISTGSVPTVPASIAGLEASAYLTPKTATDLLKPPKSVFIIGGGKTGVEFASLFCSFGSTVSIAEISPRLLPEEDAEAGTAIKRVLEARGSSVLSSTRVTQIRKDGLVYRVTYLRGDVEHVVKAERILLAGGRAPNLDLGLDNAEVEYSPLGIAVNATLQTSAKHIYAAGSVTGNTKTVEGAVLEAEQAAINMIKRDKATVNYGTLPQIIYSQPLIARVGVNEGEALRKDIATTSAVVALEDTVAGRAGRDQGIIKMTVDKKGTLVGAMLITDEPADAINTLALAIEAKMTAESLSKIPLAYGSTGEAITLAARQLAD